MIDDEARDTSRAMRSERWLTLSKDIIPLKDGGVLGAFEQFEVEFLEGVVERDPAEESSLIALGHIYTARGEYLKGLEVDQRLAKLRPDDPIAHYNLACSLSILDHVEESFNALEQAIRLGYKDVQHLLTDDDLRNLRNDERFRGFCQRMGLLDSKISES